MRKLLLLLTALTLFCLSASAQTVYTVISVTDCAKTDSRYDRFYQSGQTGPVVPGLAEGLVPQGICFLPKENALLFAGYRSDKGMSALIEVDRESGEIIRQVSLQYADGRPYSGHAGGVCATDTDIYLSNAHMLYRIPLEIFSAVSVSGVCRFSEEIPVPVNSSYCCFSEGVLWVGEFQYGGDYKTDVGHYRQTADGLQRAWTCGYIMSADQDFAAPDYILSVAERIQGITVRKDAVYLSQSYGRRADSVIYQYEGISGREPDGETELGGKTVPVWNLDSSCRKDVLLCPPMSECLCAVEDGIYVLFESAAQTYMDARNPSVNPMDRVFLLTDY